MAVPVTVPDRPARRVSARHFVRLKLRVLGNNFRGEGWRIALFVLGALFGLWVAAGPLGAVRGSQTLEEVFVGLVGGERLGTKMELSWLSR